MERVRFFLVAQQHFLIAMQVQCLHKRIESTIRGFVKVVDVTSPRESCRLTTFKTKKVPWFAWRIRIDKTTGRDRRIVHGAREEIQAY
eukprot:265097-Hanusia_phi.AAC.1